MHRAFDRGLIAIGDDYRVMVSKNFMETFSHYSIKQYDRKEILFPEDKGMWPGRENLRRQREKAKLQTLLIYSSRGSFGTLGGAGNWGN